MVQTLFEGIFDSSVTSSIEILDFLLCVGVSLIIGLFLSLVHGFRSAESKRFLVTLALLPAIVCVVIMMVNGNVGAGVAVAGAFSLVRFRSAPGTAKEISSIFLSMGAGLVTGMGYLGYAVLFTLILGLAMLLLNVINFGGSNNRSLQKTLLITIPEDLNYSEVFDDLFEQFTSQHEIISVKTTNMGSLFKLRYNVTLKNISMEKKFIDELRCRNGNLEISMAKQGVNGYEL